MPDYQIKQLSLFAQTLYFLSFSANFSKKKIRVDYTL